MKVEKKILQFREIKVEEDLYPRLFCDEETVERYAEMMKAGVEFPLIVVALFEGKYYLVDGRHRLEAMQSNGEGYAQCEILTGLDRRAIFIEAVKRNIQHGRPLDRFDLKQIKIKLEDWNVSQEEIRSIVRIDVEKMLRPVATKLDDNRPKRTGGTGGMDLSAAFKGQDDDDFMPAGKREEDDPQTQSIDRWEVRIANLRKASQEFLDFVTNVQKIQKDSYIEMELDVALREIRKAVRQLHTLTKVKDDLVALKTKLEMAKAKSFEKKVPAK